MLRACCVLTAAAVACFVLGIVFYALGVQYDAWTWILWILAGLLLWCCRPAKADLHERSGRVSNHPEVPHPLHLLDDLTRHGWRGKIAAGNDWLATHLATVFGIAWTIWVFFTVPLIAGYLLPPEIKNQIFFLASGWIQLFALPLLVFVNNKIQKSTDAQSQAMYQAMTHIATVVDELKARTGE